jgi:uncharacterized delta-60 repeat protein
MGSGDSFNSRRVGWSNAEPRYPRTQGNAMTFTRWWQSARKPRRIASAAGQKARFANKRLGFESLEDRQLLSASSLDTTFNATGFTLTQFSAGSNDQAKAEAIQSDGKIVVAGGSNTSAALARYNYNGTLDTTFGTGGKMTSAPGSASVFNSVQIQSDGKIVAAGSAVISGINEFMLIRYNTDGSVDTTFGTSGIVTMAPISGQASQINGIQLQSDSKIVAAGSAGTTSEFAVARYNTNGSLDTTFGTGGLFLDQLALSSGANALAIQSNGSIVAGGFDNTAGGEDFALLRLTTAGALDTSFNTTGVVTTDLGSATNETINALAISSGGQIVAAGQSGVNGAVVRYNINGSLDASFNATGKLVLPVSQAGGSDILFGAAIQSDGRIVVAGQSNDSGAVSQMLVDRLNADGTFDPYFNAGAPLLLPLSGASLAQALILDANGRITLAGYTTTSPSNFAVVRLGTALSVEGNTLVIDGTAGNDSITVGFSSATAFSVVLNATGSNYTVGNSGSQIDRVEFHGGAGSDTVIYTDAINTRLGLMGGNTLNLVGAGFEFDADTSELIYLYGTASDSATINDPTAGGNTAITTATYGYLTNTGNTVFYQAASFGTVTVTAAAGSNDKGFQYSSAGTVWSATPTTSTMSGTSGQQRLVNFQHTYGQSAGSTSELAYLYGSSGADTMIGTPIYAYLSGGSGATAFFNEAIGFHSATAYGNGGADVAALYDSTGNDTYVSTPTYAYLTGGSGASLFFNQAVGFPQVSATSSAGHDTAYFYDSAGNDTFTAQPAFASMIGTGYANSGFNFTVVAGIASTGTDSAMLFDAAGSNNFFGSNVTADLASISAGSERIATNFDTVGVVQSLGNNNHKYVQSNTYTLTFTGNWS